jgi:uncharacterized protein YciI
MYRILFLQLICSRLNDKVLKCQLKSIFYNRKKGETMPLWDTYKAEAQARGALAFEVFVVQSTPAMTPADMKQNLPDHLAYQAKMEAEGALVFAGPMSDETGLQMEGMGLIIYRAASFEAARSLAENDPMHKSGARRFTIRKWIINEGSLGITVGLSGQKVTLT